jgi:hypothetical protein
MIRKSLSAATPLLSALAILILFSNNTFAEPLPYPIPKPEVSVIEAIGLATNYFHKGEDLIDTADFKKADFILDSVIYTDYFDDKFQSEWAWYISFRHPIASDITYTYKVTEDKKIVLIRRTE